MTALKKYLKLRSSNLISGSTVSLEEMSLCKLLPSTRHLSSWTFDVKAISSETGKQNSVYVVLVSNFYFVILLPSHKGVQFTSQEKSVTIKVFISLKVRHKENVPCQVQMQNK